jgi:4-diphosphocytidyl-2-C-methyl-D-erythritol kinase
VNRALRLLAPAKINWSLEVLRIRPDGYHELRSVLQTVDLCDVVTLTPADAVELVLVGERIPLWDEPPERNLAHRAAVALRERAGIRAGVRIELEKCIPVAAGLGGGSSDAAAVLRGCDELWNTQQPQTNLMEIAAEIGSDPPFFIAGGTAAAGGRGDAVEPLPDAIAPPLLIATPRQHERGEKTARMFAALDPDDFSDGYVTIGVRDAVVAGRPIDDGFLNNVFERVTTTMQPETERAMDALRASGMSPHLAGSGPSFYLLLSDDGERQAAAERVRELGFEPHAARTLSRADALRIEEL